MEFKYDDFKKYDNLNDDDFLKLKNVLPLKIYLGSMFF
jgi:hypothetical protein